MDQESTKSSITRAVYALAKAVEAATGPVHVVCPQVLIATVTVIVIMSVIVGLHRLCCFVCKRPALFHRHRDREAASLPRVQVLWTWPCVW